MIMLAIVATKSYLILSQEAWKNSIVRPSEPGDFHFFRDFTTFTTSSRVGIPVSIILSSHWMHLEKEINGGNEQVSEFTWSFKIFPQSASNFLAMF